MPSATPQPPLKKKASFRDRLKAWQRPPPDLDTAAEEDAGQPRFVYEPRHAATDFERLAVSPLSPTARPRPRPMQTLAEENTAQPSSQPRERNDDRGHTVPQRSEDDSKRRHSRSSGRGGNKRHSYTVVEDPFKASQAAAQVPVNPWPVAYVPGVHARTAAATAECEEFRSSSTSPRPPLSDYELFIARAEAEDRERREQILRSISQRSYSTAPQVNPDPHRQYASVMTGGSSSGETGDWSRRKSARYVLAGATEHLSLQEQQPPPEQQREKRANRRTGHTRHASWDPGSTVDEKTLERKKSPVSRQQQERQPKPPPSEARHHTANRPVIYGVDENFNAAGQPLRTLRRQSSLTQRIVEYIRPPKMVRPVETLVE